MLRSALGVRLLREWVRRPKPKGDRCLRCEGRAIVVVRQMGHHVRNTTGLAVRVVSAVFTADS
jgi:hypothetical protein